MKFKFFMIPACDPEKDESSLNMFCASHRIASVEKEFVSDTRNSFWSLCITYVDAPGLNSSTKKKTVDYKEVLNEKDFAMYAKLRTLRKDLAQKEGVPAYALFTNEQLAALITDNVVTLSAMAKIQGIGKARIEKYGEQFISLIKKEREADTRNTDEAPGET